MKSKQKKNTARFMELLDNNNIVKCFFIVREELRILINDIIYAVSLDKTTFNVSTELFPVLTGRVPWFSDTNPEWGRRFGWYICFCHRLSNNTSSSKKVLNYMNKTFFEIRSMTVQSGFGFFHFLRNYKNVIEYNWYYVTVPNVEHCTKCEQWSVSK